jgi:hypothetical protein
MHSTDNLNDGYLGSGKVLGYSLNKHGRENHKLEILEMCGSRELLKAREKEIVNETLLADPLNINLKYGGEGGWDQSKNSNVVLSKAQLSDRAYKSWETIRSRDKSLEAHVANSKKQGIKLNQWLTTQEQQTQTKIRGFNGQKHSEATKQKIGAKNSQHQTGSKNSQFNTCWVSDGISPRKINKDELARYLAAGYSHGRYKRKV